MRSSNKRSRNKNNRNRPNSVGNVVNRVFDSSGPEGKVRGTPQQIIDKYNQLARDAQLSNDRVNAENFQQHAEHYMRLLSEAQREQDARREQQERENRDRQAQRDADRAARGDQDDGAQATNDPADSPQPDVIDTSDDSNDSGLVETPEAKAEEKPKKPRAPRKPRKKPEPKAEDAPAETATPDAAE
ncbi:MAG: DUF4167 domain-containing protein [Marivita sp.]|uniref:DUF4167 domain-containing protein n=1 Tax=Marivita sp. TaxID=2003365 RepID=UPI0025C2A1D2|nr:DUF4167 domain-containing protein [Marivita sp.]MCI5111130.1 DUF4167 domain-containing protein [Marivita sp.]